MQDGPLLILLRQAQKLCAHGFVCGRGGLFKTKTRMFHYNAGSEGLRPDGTVKSLTSTCPAPGGPLHTGNRPASTPRTAGWRWLRVRPVPPLAGISQDCPGPSVCARIYEFAM